MKSTNINDFKEVLRRGMIENFERDGYLAPVFFFYEIGQPVISQIPNELLNSPMGKQILANIIKSICTKPTVLAAGIIIEANAVKLENDDSEITKQVLNGDIRVSELKESKDIIFMLFSTPSKEEIFVYEVNCETKTVGDKFGDGELDGIGGTFSKFFNWNRN